jgi:hypothetical protein
MLLDDAHLRAWCFTASDDDELNVFEDAHFNPRASERARIRWEEQMNSKTLRSEAIRSQRIGLSALPLIAALALSACSTPKGTITYYLPRAETALKVTQTLACNGAGDRLTQVVNVAATTAYSSDPAASAVIIEPRKIDGWLANADIAFAFTDDGRLSGVNVTTVGQGGEVLKDAVAVAKTIAAVAGAPAESAFDAKAACKTISGYAAKQAATPAKADAAKDKAKAKAKEKADDGGDAAPASGATVTLGYTAAFKYKRTLSKGSADLVTIDGPSTLKIPVDAVDATLFSELARDIPGIGFSAQVSAANRRAVPRWDNGDAVINIVLGTAADTTIEVLGLAGDMSKKDFGAVWQQTIAVPLTGDDDRISVPIPKAATFGTRKFTLALTDYGSISRLQYSATGGVSDAAGAFNTIAGAISDAKKSPTTAQQAAEVQAQADLIYQQQRKATCLAKPETCPGK